MLSTSQVLALCQTLTWGRGRALRGAPGGGHAGPTGPSSRKRGRGGAFSRGQRGTHDYTLSSSRRVYEGFGNYYNHLLCGVQTDPVSLCFRALKAEARRSRFQHKRLHNSWGRREETSLLAKADQFFLNNSTCVLALGKGGGRAGTSLCSEEGSWKQDLQSLCFQPSSGLPGPPGSYLPRLPA
uniref:Uncharacterized protein n=1 Tax=Myotis myotis TaxID=51298 RepID=A0A7J7ZXD2_MYOMY|nr:hypothetical protein mMyoMyo1_009631 [Myotis myotis]